MYLDNIKNLSEYIRGDDEVGFTNGCFDILHLGHIQFLKECKKKCRTLIVAVNTDMSPALMAKGTERPINGFLCRVGVISELRSVDYVIGFTHETELHTLINLIRPKYLFKDDTYKTKPITGQDIIDSTLGSEIVFIPNTGHSTTKIIQKIKGF